MRVSELVQWMTVTGSNSKKGCHHFSGGCQREVGLSDGQKENEPGIQQAGQKDLQELPSGCHQIRSHHTTGETVL